MSLDIGDRTVGIAVSDELLFTAQGVETIRRKSYKHDLARIRELSKQYETKNLSLAYLKYEWYSWRTMRYCKTFYR